MTRKLKRLLLIIVGAAVFGGVVLAACVIRPMVDTSHHAQAAP